MFKQFHRGDVVVQDEAGQGPPLGEQVGIGEEEADDSAVPHDADG